MPKDIDPEAVALLGTPDNGADSSEGEWSENPAEKNSWMFTGVQVKKYGLSS